MFDWLADLIGDHHDFDPGDHDAQLGSDFGHHSNIPMDHTAEAMVGAPDHIEALYALDRMTNDIDGFDLEAMKHFVSEKSFDPQEYQGLISNWKGIYGEIRGLDELNMMSHNGLHYVIPEATNNPGIDIYGLDEHGNTQEMIQVKMTDHVEYVKEALDKLPEGAKLMCPSDIAEQLHDPRILDAGFTHAELLQDLNDTIEVLNSPEAWESTLTPAFSQWLSTDFSYDPGLETAVVGV